MTGLTSAMLVMMMGQARIFLSMANHGLIPRCFASIHPQHRTPHIATLATGIAVALIAWLFPIDLLGELVSIGTLIAFIVVCTGVLILRRTQPALHRPFRVRGIWIIAPLGIAMCCLMIGFLPLNTWIRLIIWTILGLCVYFLYGYRHSNLRSKALPE